MENNIDKLLIKIYEENNKDLMFEFLKNMFFEITNKKMLILEDYVEYINKSRIYKKGVLYYRLKELLNNIDDNNFVDYFFYIIQWYYTDYRHVEIPSEVEQLYFDKDYEFEMVNMDYLEKIGFTIEDMTKELCMMDSETLPGMTDELAGDEDVWVERFKASKYNVNTLIYRGRVVGYFDLGPLSYKNYEEFLKGTIDESKIDSIHTKNNTVYPFCLTAIMVKQKYRSYKTLGIITDKFFDRLLEMAKKGIIASDIVAIAYTNEGEILCKMFDMKYICDHYIAGKIYHIKMLPIDKEHTFLKRYEEIIELYEKTKNYIEY